MLRATIGGSIFNDQVASFDVPETTQPFAQRIEIGGVLRGGYRLKDADAINLPYLLRARDERRREDTRHHMANEPSPIHH